MIAQQQPHRAGRWTARTAASTATSREAKHELYEQIYWWLRSLASEDELRRAVRDLAARYGVDDAAFCNELCMTWREIGELAADPLVTIGAHTVNHVMLRKASDDGGAQRDAAERGRDRGRARQAARRISAIRSATAPRRARANFAIAAELGFKTAVTTRPGVLFPEHAAHLTALPRISLNGEYQQLRYAKVLLSGAATAMWNGFRRVDARHPSASGFEQTWSTVL